MIKLSVVKGSQVFCQESLASKICKFLTSNALSLSITFKGGGKDHGNCVIR